ncbi:MAG: Holliday junction resolvase RuvX, partial [Nannocystaceae bacterium]
MPTNSAQTPKYTRALGLDVGSKTIGLAMTDASGAIASARDVLRRRGEKHDVEAVSAICTKEQISKIVIGLPLELDGSVGHRARRVRRFARALIAAYQAKGRHADALAEAVLTWRTKIIAASDEAVLLRQF